MFTQITLQDFILLVNEKERERMYYVDIDTLEMMQRVDSIDQSRILYVRNHLNITETKERQTE
jgi:hypothetical protein